MSPLLRGGSAKIALQRFNPDIEGSFRLWSRCRPHPCDQIVLSGAVFNITNALGFVMAESHTLLDSERERSTLAHATTLVQRSPTR